MNNKYILWFFYAIAFILSFGLIVFYGRLTIPSLWIGTAEGDPLIINNAIVLLVEIFVISIIGYINYFFYKKLYGAHRDTDSPWLKLAYSLIVIGTFTAISIFTLNILGLNR